MNKLQINSLLDKKANEFMIQYHDSLIHNLTHNPHTDIATELDFTGLFEEFVVSTADYDFITFRKLYDISRDEVMRKMNKAVEERIRQPLRSRIEREIIRAIKKEQKLIRANMRNNYADEADKVIWSERLERLDKALTTQMDK